MINWHIPGLAFNLFDRMYTIACILINLLEFKERRGGRLKTKRSNALQSSLRFAIIKHSIDAMHHIFQR